MVSVRDASPDSSAVEEKFETALPQLFQELEDWRRDCNAQPPPPDDFPATDWKAVRQGLVFLGVSTALSYVIPAVHMPSGGLCTAWLCIALLTFTVSSIAASFLLGIRMPRADTAQFWRAVRMAFCGNENFPFAVAHELLRRDLASMPRLRPYSSALLGNPSILVLVGLLSAIGGFWQNFHASYNVVALVLLLASVGVFGLALYGGKLQLSLIELARCRALLSLEISRRDSENSHPSSHTT